LIGTAADGLVAVNEARRLKPDVITMDVEMPVMDGISAVKRIMSESPTPIIMFSSLTQEGARATLDALDAGAVDFLPKDFDRNGDRAGSAAEALSRRVLVLGKTKGWIRHARRPLTQRLEPKVCAPVGAYKLVAIGASTGGPVAIQTLLATLPERFSLPLLLVVHMPASFTTAYAERLNSQCRITVKEAVEGDMLQPGYAYLAPGGKQMILERHGGESVIRIRESVSGQTYKPSVDISLGSAARIYPAGVLAVVLTGMGSDGRQAARLLKEGGSTVWSQDEASCVVYGMPQAVEKAGLSDRVLPLEEIGPMLVRLG
jgi:two-component system chemotaxis response regulator CheB